MIQIVCCYRMKTALGAALTSAMLVLMLVAYSPRAAAEVEIAKTNTIFVANGILTETPKEMPQGFVNIYSYRNPATITPLLRMFTNETGIRTKIVYITKDTDEALRRESRLSPVDILITESTIALETIRQQGLLLSVYGIGTRNAIPNSLMAKDESWFALSTSPLAVYTTKTGLGKLPDNFTYMDIADPKYRGRVCLGADNRDLTLSLIAEMISQHGEVVAKYWLAGLKDNLARNPKGGDRTQLRALNRGDCDLAIGSSRYMGKVMHNFRELKNADNIIANTPMFDTRAKTTFVDISGIAVAKHATNRENAIIFLEFMLSRKSQKVYSAINYEYPARKEIAPPPTTNSWGNIKANTNLKGIYQNYDKAVDLAEEVGLNL